MLPLGTQTCNGKWANVGSELQETSCLMWELHPWPWGHKRSDTANWTLFDKDILKSQVTSHYILTNYFQGQLDWTQIFHMTTHTHIHKLYMYTYGVYLVSQLVFIVEV